MPQVALHPSLWAERSSGVTPLSLCASVVRRLSHPPIRRLALQHLRLMEPDLRMMKSFPYLDFLPVGLVSLLLLVPFAYLLSSKLVP